MVKLPGGFSPWQAVQQAVDDINPLDGGSRDRDIFSNLGNQRTGAGQATPVWSPQPAIEVPGSPTGNGDTGQSGGSYYGSGGGGGGSSAPSYSAEDLAYLDSQKGTLERQLGRTDSTLASSLQAVLENYEKELSGANTTRGRNIEDFNTKTQVSEQGRGRELGKVDTSARMLADSLRQRLGLASGSGSSAYQITAPRAVQRDASDKRTNVLEDYSANFNALDTDKRRAEEDYNSMVEDLGKQKTAREGGVVGDIESQRNQIRENLGRVAGEKARLMGGGYNSVRAAMSPYEQQIAGGESLIDGIFNKYAAKYDVKPIRVNNTQLKDYAVDKTAVRDQQATGTQDPYAPFKNYAGKDDEENPLA